MSGMGSIFSTISQEAGADWEIGLSLIGRLQAQGDYDSAFGLYQKMEEQMSADELPKFHAAAAPLMAQNPAVPVDSEGRQAQSRALSRLQQVGDEGGMDAQARLAQQQALSTSDQNAKANRDALAQGAARRGVSNSGDEMAAQLGNASSSANSARDASLSASAEARNRALAALQGSATVGNQLRAGDVGVQESNRSSEDARSMFNAKMTSATDQFNTNAEMQNALARLKQKQMRQQAETNLANAYQNRGNQTAGDYASMGRAMNNKSQIAGNGADEYFGGS